MAKRFSQKIDTNIHGVDMTRDEVLRYLDLPSPSMQEALDLLTRVAPLMTTVYIHGPSGSGKEFAARAVHAFSARADGPFIAVNCGAIPKELLESELFGSEKGAYTGSVRTRAGLLENANGGTLFLDEIGDMPFDMQVKLLRVLEERRFSRVGGEKEIKADVRLVCATHRDLQVLVDSGQFREDLFYRINVFPVSLCGLDERRDDIPRLVELILKRFKGQGGLGDLPSFSASALAALQEARWPGNVRQLRNVIERASVLYPGQVVGQAEIERMLAPRKPIERIVETQALIESITGMLPLREEAPPTAPDVVPDIVSEPTDLQAFFTANPDFSFRDHMTRMEIAFIKGALAQSQGSVSAAARLLGLQRTTLIEKMRKYGLQREEV